MAQSFKEEYKKQYMLGKSERQKLIEQRKKFCLIQDQGLKSKFSNCLKAYGIRTRKREETVLVVPNPAYGERKRGDKLVKNYAEQKVIE